MNNTIYLFVICYGLLLLLVTATAAISTTSRNVDGHHDTTTTTDDVKERETLKTSWSTTIQECYHRGILGMNHPDYISHIPGYNQPLPSAWYSGYLTYEFMNRTVHTHYTFVEAEDNEDGAKPIIYWSNGGPGASSLFGLLTELGPLLLSELSLGTDDYIQTKIPTPIYNHYAWTRLGHILVLDQPAPIGFSYCNNSTTSHSCDGIIWTDELTSQNALMALQAFYEKYSCLSSFDLYLTGESYAGIYIPTLAREIVNYNAAASDSQIPLKGFAVGDGCLGTETDICVGLGPNSSSFDKWLLIFLAGHGQIPFTTFHEAMTSCTQVHDEENHEDTTNPVDRTNIWNSYTKYLRSSRRNTRLEESDECKKALMKVKEQVGYVYDYGLYDECTYTNGLLQQYITLQQQEYTNDNQPMLAWPSYSNKSIVYGGLNDYPCGGDIVMEHLYLSLPIVQEAFHLRSSWFSVDNAVDFDYTPTEKDLRPFYKQIIDSNQGLNTTDSMIKVLVYNGDTDPAITSFASESWTSQLGIPVVEDWRPWTVDNCRKIGGYVTRYEGQFDFLTIRGAGHMVPTNKAAAAFAFLKSWIHSEDYPQYIKECDHPQLHTSTSMLKK